MQVHIPNSIFLIVMAFLSISPHSPSTQTQARKVQLPESKMEVVLDIIQKDARPKAVGDEYLFFRLYASGEVEFEDRHQKGPSEWEFRIHKIELGEKEKERFLKIARRCLLLPNDYDPLQRLEEKVSIYRIRIRDDDDYRQAVIHNYSPENEKTDLYYPKEAKELIQEVRYIRQQYHQET